METRTQETVMAAFIALLSEAVAVTLFMLAAFVWIAIYATDNQRQHSTHLPAISTTKQGAR